MTNQIPPAPWHVNPVDHDDEVKIREIMAARYEQTGEQPSKAGTIRRAVRLLWRTEVGDDA